MKAVPPKPHETANKMRAGVSGAEDPGVVLTSVSIGLVSELRIYIGGWSTVEARRAHSFNIPNLVAR